jgi:tRNA(Ile2) C34 agmatinyltransferase TiaS
MFSHWFEKRKCPACGHKMFTDGNNWYCNCGFEIEIKNKRAPKKYGYRTAHDRDRNRDEERYENSDV